MKPRINIYLDDHVAAQLALLSKRPGLNKSRIVNDALDRFFNPERDQTFEKAMLRRLDHMSKSQAKIERNESISTETLALFVRYFLTITPPLPQTEQASAHALGKERFEAFVAQVGRRLATDRNLLSEVLEQLVDNKPDLFVQDPDAQLDMAGKQQANPSENSEDETLKSDCEDDLPPLRPVVIIDDDEEVEITELNDLEETRNAGNARTE